MKGEKKTYSIRKQNSSGTMRREYSMKVFWSYWKVTIG